jgi:hypothetical protein
MKFGMKINVTVKILILGVKSGELFGTLNAEKTSTMSLAASAHLLAPLQWLMSVSHVKKISIGMLVFFAILLARMVILEMAQSVGRIAQLERMIALPSAQTPPMPAQTQLRISVLTLLLSLLLQPQQPLKDSLICFKSLETWAEFLSTLAMDFVRRQHLQNLKQ